MNKVGGEYIGLGIIHEDVMAKVMGLNVMAESEKVKKEGEAKFELIFQGQIRKVELTKEIVYCKKCPLFSLHSLL